MCTSYSPSKPVTVVVAASSRVSLAYSLSDNIVANCKWNEKLLVDFSAEKNHVVFSQITKARWTSILRCRIKMYPPESHWLDTYKTSKMTWNLTKFESQKLLTFSFTHSAFWLQKISSLSRGPKYMLQLSTTLTHRVLLLRTFKPAICLIDKSELKDSLPSLSYRREVKNQCPLTLDLKMFRL